MPDDVSFATGGLVRSSEDPCYRGRRSSRCRNAARPRPGKRARAAPRCSPNAPRRPRRSGENPRRSSCRVARPSRGARTTPSPSSRTRHRLPRRRRRVRRRRRRTIPRCGCPPRSPPPRVPAARAGTVAVPSEVTVAVRPGDVLVDVAARRAGTADREQRRGEQRQGKQTQAEVGNGRGVGGHTPDRKQKSGHVRSLLTIWHRTDKRDA